MMSRALPARVRRSLLLITALSMAGACVKDGAAAVRRRVARGRAPHAAVWSPATLSDVQGVPIADLKTALAARLAGKAPEGITDGQWHHTQALYKSLGETPLWLTSDGVANARVRELCDAVLSVTTDALRLDHYPIVELTNALKTAKQAKPTAEQLANADVLLSSMYAAMGSDLLVGQISPKGVGQSWHIDPNEDDVDSALVHSLTDSLRSGIEEMRPPEEDYAALQKELAHYRQIDASGAWPRVPSGKTLAAGQKDSPERLAALRKRLSMEGFLSDSGAANGVYDKALADAVGEFQTRHAITVDKRLSPETVQALNVPVAYRLGQIAANLERYRWMPRTLGTRYIYVNVPAFQLTAYDSGEKSLEMKVIVGQEYEDKATPVFSDSMEMVVFRPYWNITPDIQRKEVGPKAAADPGYMDRENMEYYKDGGETRIRQKPGGKNALGFVKFLFPNSFNIYLHDTPNHELFNKDVRAFSHGCVRLEKPAELAQWVLGWDAAKVQEAMDSGPDNRTVKLPKKIPVYITYGTAFVKNGVLFFGNDLYHRDEALVKAAANGAIESDAAKQNLATLKSVAGG